MRSLTVVSNLFEPCEECYFISFFFLYIFGLYGRYISHVYLMGAICMQPGEVIFGFLIEDNIFS